MKTFSIVLVLGSLLGPLAVATSSDDSAVPALVAAPVGGVVHAQAALSSMFVPTPADAIKAHNVVAVIAPASLIAAANPMFAKQTNVHAIAAPAK